MMAGYSLPIGRIRGAGSPAESGDLLRVQSKESRARVEWDYNHGVRTSVLYTLGLLGHSVRRTVMHNSFFMLHCT